MRIDYGCLPCLVNQAVRVAEITKADNREELFKKVFACMADIDFSRSNPEVIGATFRLIKEHINNDDPYRETREYYNRLFLGQLEEMDKDIAASTDPFTHALKHAIIGNLIDFNPVHNSRVEEIMEWFTDVDSLSMTIDHSAQLADDLAGAKSLLYLGDNCGEICLDKLFLKQIKLRYPSLCIYFGVRGEPVVNDSVEADAYFVGIDSYAKVISNGDDSLGTVLRRTSAEFSQIYHAADVVIAKGQGNYESLSDEPDKKIYFLLMAKCAVIANNIGVAQKSILCINSSSLPALRLNPVV